MPPSIATVIAGPTGSGKTAVAVELARRIEGEIVNFDSVQMYRGFDIGSAKPSADDRRNVVHHLLDLLEATDEYSAADFQRDADAAVADIRNREKAAILTGGTFFYLRAFLAGLPEMPPRDENLRRRLDAIHVRPGGAERLRRLLARIDPISSSRINSGDWHRIQRALEVYLLSRRPISTWDAPRASSDRRVEARVFALGVSRAALVARLDRRTELMYAGGLIEETARLLSRYPSTARPFEAIGYREAKRHLAGDLTLQEAISETQRRTRAYAKRQMTWLRSERDLQWIDAEADVATIVSKIHDAIRSGENV